MIDIPSFVNDTFADDKSTNPMIHSGYDWATFMAAYAAGRWDPHRTPNPPLACQVSASDAKPQVIDEGVTSSGSSPSTTVEQRLPPTSIPTLGIGVARNSTGSIKSRTAMPLHLPISNHRARNLLSASLPNHPVADQPLPSSSALNTDVHATVATMRWAAARVDISPLALPSPEHELTDPMRGVTAALPGAHSRDSSSGSDYLVTPGGTKRLRLPSFWRGTTDVENKRLPSIDGSPASPLLQPIDLDQPLITPKLSESAVVADEDLVIITPIPTSSTFALPPSSNPDPSSALTPTMPRAAPPALYIHPHAHSVPPPTDYFGDAKLPPPDLSGSRFQSQEHDKPREPVSAPAAPLTMSGLPAGIGQAPSIHDDDAQLLSAPSQLRRISLARQASSPLPVSSLPESGATNSRHVGGRVSGVASDNTGHKIGRAARFEQCFANLGYLQPPIPPDEIERRRALYKSVPLFLFWLMLIFVIDYDPLDSTSGTPARTRILIESYTSSSSSSIRNASSYL